MSGVAADHDPDRDVLAGERHDGAGVEDFVEPEPPGPRIGPPEPVGQAAQRVQDPAGRDKDQGGQPGAAQQLRKHERRRPPDAQVHQDVQPPRCIGPGDAEHGSEGSASPDRSEDGGTGATGARTASGVSVPAIRNRMSA